MSLTASVALASLLATVMPCAAVATVRNVSTTTGLERAVRASAPGDEIVLAAGSYAPEATLRVRHRLTLRGPRAFGGGGAAIGGVAVNADDPPHILAVERGATLTVRDLTLTSSAADGFIADVRGALRLEHATVSGATGVALVVETGGALSTLNATISDNAEFGIVVMPAATATLASSTIAGNAGGGIDNDLRSTVRLANSIVASASPASSGDCRWPVQSSVASLDIDGTCGVNMSANPMLGSLADNGGPANTRAPGAASPAVDAGRGCPAVDQRYAPRADGRCDLGAVEVGATPPPNAPPSPTVLGDLPRCDPIARSGSRVSARIVSAAGALRAAGHRATFRLSFAERAGRWRGGGIFADPGARVRLRVAAPRAVTVDRRGTTATLRARARDLGTGRAVCVTLRVRSRGTGWLSLTTGSGYRRTGSLVTGSVRLVRASGPPDASRSHATWRKR